MVKRITAFVKRASFLCLVGGGFLFLAGCSGGSSNTPTTPTPARTPTEPTPTAPAVSWSLSGKVTESAPTTEVAISGATVTIGDGPNAGATTVTDATGAYRFNSLDQAGFTVEASAEGYRLRSDGVTLTSNQVVNFELDPVSRHFTLSCPSAVRLDTSAVTASCTVTSSHFGNTVDLRCENPPSGVPCAFDPSQVTVPQGESAVSNLIIDTAFASRAGTYTLQTAGTGVDGLRRTSNVQLTITTMCSGFMEQESYTGNACGTGQGICWGFRDRYTVFTPGEFFGAPGYEFTCAERTVQVVRGSHADYQHVLDTILLKRAASTRP